MTEKGRLKSHLDREEKLELSILESILINPKRGSSNHFICDCLFCGKEKHFYIQKFTQLWDCKKCGESGNINKLLFKLNKTYLLQGKRIFLKTKLEKISNLIVEMSEEEVDYSLPQIKMPAGFKPFKVENSYLKGRNFDLKHYKFWGVGETKILNKFKNYVIFPVKHLGVNVGYIARSILKKDELDELKKKGVEIPRYQNSKFADFSKMLLGFDEVDSETNTLFLVEGLFDKYSLDKNLKLYNQSDFKACCTYGKSISDRQIDLIRTTNVKNVILIQDPDAVPETRKSSHKLSIYFNTLVGFSGDKDLGDSSRIEIDEILNNLTSPFRFSLDKVKIIKLK